ncbi:hypothetical protein KAU08_08300 [bacterium]|nr:hypothetical protein [bacterium]
MDSNYLNQPVTVKLITGESLPDGVLFWGKSSLGEDILWFGVPKPDEVHKTEVEFHIPRSSIAYIRLEDERVQ